MGNVEKLSSNTETELKMLELGCNWHKLPVGNRDEVAWEFDAKLRGTDADESTPHPSSEGEKMHALGRFQTLITIPEKSHASIQAKSVPPLQSLVPKPTALAPDLTLGCHWQHQLHGSHQWSPRSHKKPTTTRTSIETLNASPGVLHAPWLYSMLETHLNLQIHNQTLPEVTNWSNSGVKVEGFRFKVAEAENVFWKKGEKWPGRVSI